jgi:hypothetical protein
MLFDDVHLCAVANTQHMRNLLCQQVLLVSDISLDNLRQFIVPELVGSNLAQL